MSRFQILFTVIVLLTVLGQTVESREKPQTEVCKTNETWKILIEDLKPKMCPFKAKEIKVNSSIKEKVKIPSKKVDKFTKLQKLFRWMNKMKTIWIDFPVFEVSNKKTTDKTTSEKMSLRKSWLSSCKNDKVTLDHGN